MENLQTLILDVDGTLADTEETHRRAFNAAFSDFGLDWNWSRPLYTQLLTISGGRERMRQYAESLGSAFDSPQEKEQFFRELHKVKSRYYQRMLVAGHVELRPGVLRLLNEARGAGLKLAIATSSARANVDALLESNLPVGWTQWFDVIATSDEVDEKKPSPAVYDYTLQTLGADPRHCIAIEDTPNGLRAALAAHLKVIITTHYFTRHCDFTGASLVVDQLGEPEHPCKVASASFENLRCVDVAALRRALAAPECGGRTITEARRQPARL